MNTLFLSVDVITVILSLFQSKVFLFFSDCNDPFGSIGATASNHEVASLNHSQS